VKDTFGYSSTQKVTSERDIRVDFTGKNLTKFGGIQLLRKFLGRLKIKEELESGVPIKKREEIFLDLSLFTIENVDIKGLCIKWDYNSTIQAWHG